MAIDVKLKRVFFLEFKRSTDREERFWRLKRQKRKYHNSIIEALREVAPGWEIEQINFVVGNRGGSVMENDFYAKLESLGVHVGGNDKIFIDHVTQVCEVHDRVILSFLQQIQAFSKANTKGLGDNIEQNVYA